MIDAREMNLRSISGEPSSTKVMIRVDDQTIWLHDKKTWTNYDDVNIPTFWMIVMLMREKCILID